MKANLQDKYLRVRDSKSVVLAGFIFLVFLFSISVLVSHNFLFFGAVQFSVAVLTFGCTGRNRRAASFFLKNICANKFNKFSNLWRSVAPVNLFVRISEFHEENNTFIHYCGFSIVWQLPKHKIKKLLI